jgi:small subunit ribosomal protein S16
LQAGQIAGTPSTNAEGNQRTVAVKLRLMRMGKKKQPTYRVVAADSRSPRNGRFIEIIGTYEPRLEPSGLRIDNVRAVDWLRKGATPTDRVETLLKLSGAWEHFENGTEPPAAEPQAAPAEEAASA